MRHALVLTLAVVAISIAGCGNDADEVAGTYTLDVEDFVPKAEAAMMEQLGPMLAQMPPEQLAMMKEKMLAGMKETKVNVEITPDGIYKITSVMQGNTDVITGTWTRAGDVLTFVEVEENGKPKDKPMTSKATFKDGKLMYKPEADMPFDLVLVKK